MGDFATQNNQREQVMDNNTPQRTKNNQITKFEESPVFNFLNGLSPIKPVKSTHIAQTIHPLSFASLPSVFASPHVSESSRFLQRNQLSDPSKPEFCSDDGIIFEKNKENLDPRVCYGEMDREPSYECSKLVVGFAENFNYEYCDGSNSNLRTRCGLKANHMAEYVEVNSDGVNQIDQNNAASSCDWENLFSHASDLLVFESPNEREFHKISIDPGTSFNTTMQCDTHNGDQVGEGGEGMENDEPRGVIAGPSTNNPSETMDFEHLCGFYRGVRRRCLVFEKAGAGIRNLNENSRSDSNDQQLDRPKTGNDSSSYNVLPGIGLHLNALTTTFKDYKVEASASRRLLIGPSSSIDFHLPTTNGQESLNYNNIIVASSERETNMIDNGVLPVEDSYKNEEMNQTSPKKKRRRLEQGVEGGACKRCNCKKSKCLKLYCECFAAGVYCVEPCACIDCFNKPVHEETVLATRKQIESRNPLAFAPKVIRGSESVSQTVDDPTKTPASARHKRGCNCKKSGCLKKYCECYQGGVGCSINCRCEGCKNAFGRKEGSSGIGMEVEFHEDESDVSDKNIPDKSLQITTIEQKSDFIPPSTPSHAGRLSVHHPFSSKEKPPKSSFPSPIGSSSGYNYENQSVFQLPPMFDKRFETLAEDEMPDFLQGRSPICGIKSLSPNQKRVSSPRGVGGTSPGLRSSRKLILQSIPSFPSLTHNQ